MQWQSTETQLSIQSTAHCMHTSCFCLSITQFLRVCISEFLFVFVYICTFSVFCRRLTAPVHCSALLNQQVPVSMFVFVFLFVCIVFVCTVFVSVFGCRLTDRSSSLFSSHSRLLPTALPPLALLASVHQLSTVLPPPSLFVCLLPFLSTCLLLCLFASEGHL